MPSPSFAAHRRSFRGSYLLFFLLFASALSWAQPSRLLRVGIYEFRPLAFIDAQGRPAGLFVDVLEHIARQEGWALEFVMKSWSQTWADAQSGKVDIMGPIAESEQREALFDYPEDYLLLDWGVIHTPPGGHIMSILDLSGKRIAALGGQSVIAADLAKLLKQFEIEAQIIELGSFAEIFSLVGTGGADACIAPNLTAFEAEEEYGLRRSAIVVNPIRLTFAAPKGAQTEIISALSRHIALLRADPDSLLHQRYAYWTRGQEDGGIPAAIWWILGSTAALALLALGWNLSINSRVEAKTRALLREKERARGYLDIAEVILLAFDTEGRINLLNRKGYQLLGYTPGELDGKNWFELCVPPEARPGLVAKYREIFSGSVRVYEENENEVLTKDGNRRLISWRNAVIRDADGTILGGLSSGLDITESKKAELLLAAYREHLEVLVRERTAELEQARNAAERAYKVKSIFLANISHEIRTPMNAVLGFAQLLISDPSLREETVDMVRIIHHSGEHLLSMINNILEMSRIEAGKPSLNLERCRLEPLLREVLAMFLIHTKDKGLSLELSIEDPLPAAIWSDVSKLRQILINLIGNAIKFTPSGSVRLRVTMPGPDRFQVDIEDTGIGIPPDEMDRLFKPFERTGIGQKTASGTGLGLAISKSHALLLGGDITIPWSSEAGSCFRLTFNAKCLDADEEEAAGKLESAP